MELEDLKKTWDKISSENEKRQLNQEDIDTLLKNRALDITEKIGRNIRIGLIIILAWIGLWFAIEMLFTPLLEKFIQEPTLSGNLINWMTAIEGFTYLLIIVAIFVFWVNYNRIEKQNSTQINLKKKLTLHIKTLNLYKTMFYIILIIILLNITFAFSTGFISGFNSQTVAQQLNISNISFFKWMIIGFSFLLTLGIVISIYYFLFHLFFNRLYGKYLKQLKNTLKEFDEVNSLH